MLKINKKFKFIFGSTVFGALIPMTAVSCLYDNDKTVIFAKTFAKENGFLDKQRVADPKNRTLVKFEDELYKANYLTYTFSSINLRFKQTRFEINNKHLQTKINNLVTISGKTATKNETNYNQFKNLITQTESNYQSYLANNSDKTAENTNDIQILLNQNKLVLNDFDTKFEILTNLINEYYKQNNGTKSLSEILKLDFGGGVETAAIKNEQAIKSNLSAILSATIYNIPLRDFNQVITYQAVQEVLENYVKDTPWATYYNWFKYEQTAASKSTFTPITNMLRFDNVSLTYIIEFSPTIINNGLATPVFQSVWDKVQEVHGASAKRTEATKVLKTIWEAFWDTSNSYSVKGDLIESSSQGMGSGFGPIHLAKGQNPSTGKEDDAFKIFDKALDDLEANEFLLNPTKFVNNNLDRIFLAEKEHNLKIQISLKEENIKALDAQIAVSGNQAEIQQWNREKAREQRDINRLKPQIAQAQKFRENLKEVLSQLKLNPDNETLKAQLEELKKPYQSDIDLVFERLNNGIKNSATSRFGLAELFTNLLFLNGIYKTHAIKVYKTTNPAQKNNSTATYLVEFEDQGKWYVLDIYSLLSDAQKERDKVFNIESYIYSQLAGYIIDDHYVNNAHVTP